MNETRMNMLKWHNILLEEANSIANRLASDQFPTDIFLEDLAVSLERLAERVRREKIADGSET